MNVSLIDATSTITLSAGLYKRNLQNLNARFSGLFCAPLVYFNPSISIANHAYLKDEILRFCSQVHDPSPHDVKALTAIFRCVRNELDDRERFMQPRSWV
ncbi:MAG: hypothetical protein D4R76_05400 [Methylococcus sp.]|nr:MAG: hypothetical protein D4R76_05400 [Methylococcus sp.]